MPLDETLPDALRDALGKVIADERRHGERAYQVLEARSETILANLRAAIAENLDAERKRIDAQADLLQRMFTERMAMVRDGEQGPVGPRGEQGDIGPQGPGGDRGLDGAAGARGEQGLQGDKGDAGPQGPQGERGTDGTNGERGEQGEQGPQGERGEQGPQGERGDDGKQGETGPSGKDGAAGATGARGDDGAQGPQGDKGEQGPQGERGAAGERGLDGAAGAQGSKGEAGDTGPQGLTGQRGENGEHGPRGEKGERGELPIVKAFVADTVYYAGEVVSHLGSTFQAIKDTGSAPPHKDWNALAVRGLDARTPDVRGTWSVEADYRALDIVALNGGTFIARRDEPGPCPGDGWQLVARQGKPGNEGERGPAGDKGERGERGLKGEAGVHVIGWEIDRREYRAIAKMSDGRITALELRELFEQFQLETESAR